jgi:hypothetical protein
VYENAIHILGSNNSGNGQKHYKWDGTEWTEVSTLPYEFRSGSCVVYNDEIHIIGGIITGNGKHYRYDKETSAWVKASTLPVSVTNNSAVVYNNEIHIPGTNNNSNGYYKWDGEKWIDLGNLSYVFQSGSCVVYNNQITMLGSYGTKVTNYFCRIDDTDPKATLTFIAQNVLSEKRAFDANSTDGKGWEGADLREYLNSNAFISMLPSDLQAGIKTVNKITDGGYSNPTLINVQDRIWIPSIDEVGGSSNLVLEGQGETYPIFTDNDSRIRHTADGDEASYYLRSCRKDYNSMVAYVYTTGIIGVNLSTASKENVLIGFCL